MDRVDKVGDMFAGDLKKNRYIGSRDEYRRTFSSMLQTAVSRLNCETEKNKTLKLTLSEYYDNIILHLL